MEKKRKTDLKKLVKKAQIEKSKNSAPDPEIHTVSPIIKPKKKVDKIKEKVDDGKIDKSKEDKKAGAGKRKRADKKTGGNKARGKEEPPAVAGNGERKKTGGAGILERILPPWF